MSNYLKELDDAINFCEVVPANDDYHRELFLSSILREKLQLAEIRSAEAQQLINSIIRYDYNKGSNMIKTITASNNLLTNSNKLYLNTLKLLSDGK